MKSNRFLIAWFFSLIPLIVQGEVTVPKIFSNDMVLQRQLVVPIWGMADPGENVTVRFAGQTKQTIADDDGKWMVRLDPLATSSQKQTLQIQGTNRLAFSGVLVGEVWLCSGQSNMADSFNSKKNRFIDSQYFEKGLTGMRVSTRQGWTVVDEKTQRTISRVGFFLGKDSIESLTFRSVSSFDTTRERPFNRGFRKRIQS